MNKLLAVLLLSLPLTTMAAEHGGAAADPAPAAGDAKASEHGGMPADSKDAPAGTEHGGQPAEEKKK
jgi:hypothetical protein